MKASIFSWIAAIACAAWGAAFFNIISKMAVLFAAMDVPVSIAGRLVFFVGPWGWLLFSLLVSLLIIRFRSSRMNFIIAASFLLLALGVTTSVRVTCIGSHTIISSPLNANGPDKENGGR